MTKPDEPKRCYAGFRLAQRVERLQNIEADLRIAGAVANDVQEQTHLIGAASQVQAAWMYLLAVSKGKS